MKYTGENQILSNNNKYKNNKKTFQYDAYRPPTHYIGFNN